MSCSKVTPIRPGADRPATETPAYRLSDEDASAYQVRQFLRSVQPYAGLARPEKHFEARELVHDLVLQLAIHGDEAMPQLTPEQCATMIRFFATMEPRKECESYSAGGVVACGFNIVLYWVANHVGEMQPQAVQS